MFKHNHFSSEIMNNRGQTAFYCTIKRGLSPIILLHQSISDLPYRFLKRQQHI